MSKVGVFFTKDYEEIEALTVVDLLRRAGIPTDMISVTGEMEVTGSHQITVKMDKLFEEINFDEMEMIVLPGGPGTKDLEMFEPLMKQLEIFYKEGKMISAICAAPSILGHRGMLQGKTACSFPDYESHLEGAVIIREPAVTDGNVITGRGMGCAISFGLEIVAHFKGSKAAEELAEKIIFQVVK